MQFNLSLRRIASGQIPEVCVVVTKGGIENKPAVIVANLQGGTYISQCLRRMGSAQVPKVASISTLGDQPAMARTGGYGTNTSTPSQ